MRRPLFLLVFPKREIAGLWQKGYFYVVLTFWGDKEELLMENIAYLSTDHTAPSNPLDYGTVDPLDWSYPTNPPMVPNVKPDSTTMQWTPSPGKISLTLEEVEVLKQAAKDNSELRRILRKFRGVIEVNWDFGSVLDDLDE